MGRGVLVVDTLYWTYEVVLRGEVPPRRMWLAVLAMRRGDEVNKLSPGNLWHGSLPGRGRESAIACPSCLSWRLAALGRDHWRSSAMP